MRDNFLIAIQGLSAILLMAVPLWINFTGGNPIIKVMIKIIFFVTGVLNLFLGLKNLGVI